MDFRINTCDVRSTKDRECESESIGWVLGHGTIPKRCCGRRPGRFGIAKTFEIQLTFMWGSLKLIYVCGLVQN